MAGFSVGGAEHAEDAEALAKGCCVGGAESGKGSKTGRAWRFGKTGNAGGIGAGGRGNAGRTSGGKAAGGSHGWKQFPQLGCCWQAKPLTAGKFGNGLRSTGVKPGPGKSAAKLQSCESMFSEDRGPSCRRTCALLACGCEQSQHLRNACTTCAAGWSWVGGSLVCFCVCSPNFE